jgi:RHS repeat-associated protein
MRLAFAVAALALLCRAASAQSVSITSEGGASVAFIVPLGIEAPPGAVSAFRIVATLPSGVSDGLAKSGRELRVELTTELVPGAKSGAMPAGHPRSSLLVPLRSPYPAALHAQLRLQRGANRLESPIIVALADPRASIDHAWPLSADKRAVGCRNCDRPQPLIGKREGDGVYELFTAGRHIVARLDPAAVEGTPYAWLAERGRLQARAGTIMADTIRPPAIRVAANGPPVAAGLLQETTYLHSGELETSGAELGIGRTYRSHTLGLSPLGAGWDADVFRRLRALPNGDVEYRDGAEVWLFSLANNAYRSPTGLFLRLSRTPLGWTLVDQKLREAHFDDLGRLVRESDEFFDPKKEGSGNITRYLYGAHGRLSRIVDAYGRETRLFWTGDLLTEVVDWRDRRVTYRYDAHRRLEHVDLPKVAPHEPRTDYGYAPPGSSLKEQLELAPNLVTIRDPKESANGGAVRVTFGYTGDRVTSQRWATGESASFVYLDPATVNVTDAFGQERQFVLTTGSTEDLLADRAHVTEMRETSIPVWSGASFGQLPQAVSSGPPATTPVERTTRFVFDGGLLRSSKVDGVGETALGYVPAEGPPGMVVKTVTTTPSASGGGASSFLAATVPITRTYHYQKASAFLEGVDANGGRVEIADPHRARLEPLVTNDSVAEQQKFDGRGRLTEVASTGGTDSESAGAKANIRYYPDDAPLHARGRPHVVTEGEGADAIATTYEYPTPLRTTATDARGVVTTTDVDDWDRPVRLRVTRVGDPLVLEQTFHYDATGRLERTTEKKGTGLVTTQHGYDVMGRRTSTTRDSIATVGSVTSSTKFELAALRVTTTSEGAAVTTTELDRLGRIVRSVTDTGSSPIERRHAYDLAGNRVFTTDMFSAVAHAFDAHGRQIGTRNADGTAESVEYDHWSRLETAKTLDSNGATIAESSYQFTDAGRLEETSTRVSADVRRSTVFGWDGGGRTTRTATNGRASASAFDLAGRLRSRAVGPGDLSAISEPFAKTEVTAHDGALPAQHRASERRGPAYTSSTEHDLAANPTTETVGTLEWKRTFDELGSLTEAAEPGRTATKWDVDARGVTEKETLPDNAEKRFEYEKSGAQGSYTDPDDEKTTTQRDRIGRPLVRTYPDGTTEVIGWNGPRLESVTDRRGRKQIYHYNDKGQIEEIRDADQQPTDRFAYDDGGRMSAWTTADVEVTWGDFDLDGNPRQTSQKRFRNGSGLGPNAVVLDEFVQEHRWNEHGERVRFSMPAAPGAVLSSAWAKWVRQAYDAMGNVTEIARIDDEFDLPGQGVTLMTGSYRAAGRPDVRTLVAAGGAIVRTYGYDEKTSQLERLEVKARGVVVAGSETAHDGLQVSEARMLGVSGGERAARFEYDVRSRLSASVFWTTSAVPPVAPIPGRAREELSQSDFRKTQERTPQLDALSLSAARARGVDTSKIDPPTASFDEKPGGGHKIDKVTKGPIVQPFGWQGPERVDDGRFVYQFDARGRLIRATEKTSVPPTRRIVYTYTGGGRIAGRRAEYANVANPGDDDWKLEDRAPILAADALPPDTTFVWDPITDRLISVFGAGEPTAPLKQILHGDLAYDDPLETTTASSRLYPVYDEVGTGGLQVVLDSSATVVARRVAIDPYGASDLSLSGAAVDAVAVTLSSSSTSVSLRATEQLSSSSVADGVRLAAVSADGTVVRTFASPAVLADPYTVRWTLSPSEFATLSAPPATALSIAATSSLRASAWSSSVALMPPPEWVLASQPVFTSPALPFELRESLSSLESFRAGIPAGESRTTSLYEVETLALLASAAPSPAIATLPTARFQALPFFEAATGLVYARARWLDPTTGSFLSPDPMGYRDSSNLYAFAGGDPVNGRDPTGEAYWIDRSREIVATLRRKRLPEWDRERVQLLAELRDLQERRYETDPRAPSTPSVVRKAWNAIFASDWGDAAEAEYGGTLERGYRSTHRAQVSELAEVYGTHDRGKALQDATFRDVGGRGVNVAGKAIQSEAQAATLKVLAAGAGAAISARARSNADVIAEGDLRHLNGAIAEAHGYHQALSRGHLPIQGPGKVTAPGVDFITFDPGSSAVVIWDAKYRASGRFPASIPAWKVTKWTEEARTAVESLPEGVLKTKARQALEAGRIRPDIFKWPQ